MGSEEDNLLPEGAPGANTPEISVSELAQALKRTVEDRFGRVRVRGEISNYRGPHASGHAYFSLKDAGARLDAVVWKGTLARLRHRPQEGFEVVATGRITTFPGKSSYQIVIEAMEPAGVGALMAVLEARRQQFVAEGLFDAARKRPIPFLPRTIGVVTSPTGAVIRDILHRINERFPRHVLVWPVRVQGETSAAEVAAAIHGFNTLPGDGAIPRPDVIIVARGGGSLEDLWSFNEETTVRAAAASDIPLIAAIGHETDWTLVDFVADLRAPTPTGAAEKAVPVRAELREQLAGRARRLGAASARNLAEQRKRVASLTRLLPQADALLATPRQRLDRAIERLRTTMLRRCDARRMRLAQSAARLSRHAPQAELARVREKLDGLGKRLELGLAARVALARRDNDGAARRLATASARLPRAFVAIIETRREKLVRLTRLQESLSHRAVLARGFALARDDKGAIIRSVAHVAPGERLQIEVADGAFPARVEEMETVTKPAELKRRGRNPVPRGGQGTLF
jgi:exodeoxyribonuclease VII large subunit